MILEVKFIVFHMPFTRPQRATGGGALLGGGRPPRVQVPSSRDCITPRLDLKTPDFAKEGFFARKPAKPPETPRSRGRANELRGVCEDEGTAKAEAVQGSRRDRNTQAAAQCICLARIS